MTMENIKEHYNMEETLKFVEEGKFEYRIYILPDHPNYALFKDKKGGVVSDISNISYDSWISDGVTCYGKIESSVIVLRDTQLRSSDSTGFICKESTITNSNLYLSHLSVSRSELSGIITLNKDTENFGDLEVFDSKVVGSGVMMTYSKTPEDSPFHNIVNQIIIEDSVIIGNFTIKVLEDECMVRIVNCNLAGNRTIEDSMSNKYVDYEQDQD